MKFTDVYTCLEQRFSLGVEAHSGRCYLSIPVSNGRVDYEEHYWIERAQFDAWLQRPDAALTTVVKCRNRELDAALVFAPGANRGCAG